MDCCKASIVMRATRQVALELIELLREEEPTTGVRKNNHRVGDKKKRET